jgi:anti-sigma B factor antagonist
MSASNDFVVERVGDTIVIMPGPRMSALDNANLIESRSELVDAIRKTTTSAVIVDFSQVGYFGSLLLDTLCVVWKTLRERSGTMALCHVSDVAQEILAKSKLNSLWPIYSSRQDAIDAKTRPDAG